MSFDRRLTPARPDLASLALKGRVDARRFVEGNPARVTAAVTALRGKPDLAAGIDTELTYGEPVTIFEQKDGFVWLQSARDGYVGYATAADIGPAGQPATHRVAALRTYLYPGPSIKLPHLALVPMNARLAIVGTEGQFAIADTGAHVIAHHLEPLGQAEADFVAVAERYVGTPYLWGGRTSLGLDCSGLVQTALEAAGIAAPRDSDMQEKALGTPFDLKPDLSNLQRGDLLFWKGHVGIMTSPTEFLHANGHHMAVVAEPIAEAVERIREKSFGQVTSARRL